MDNQINIQQYHAGSNVVVCGHIQTTVCLVRRLGNPQLCSNSAHGQNVHGDTPTNVRTQDPDVVVLQNGKLGSRGQWQTLGVMPPGLKPYDMDALVQKQDRSTCSRDARLEHRHQHHSLHQEEPGPAGQSQGCDLRTHHMHLV